AGAPARSAAAAVVAGARRAAVGGRAGAAPARVRPGRALRLDVRSGDAATHRAAPAAAAGLGFTTTGRRGRARPRHTRQRADGARSLLPRVVARRSLNRTHDR